MEYFVVSDIHGCLRNFNEVLENFNPQKQQLILLGDYVDRGPDSLGVLQKIIELKKLYPSTIVLLGNHENLFLKFLHDKMDLKELVHYLDECGGKETLESFTDELIDTYDFDHLENNLETTRLQILSHNKEIIDFLQTDLQYYYETENIIFTHAGYDSTIASWKNTSNDNFIWIRNHYKVRPKTHHVNVFGHTPVFEIREIRGEGYSSDPLLIDFPVGAYLAIDGACAYGRQLNAVVLNKNGDLVKSYTSK